MRSDSSEHSLHRKELGSRHSVVFVVKKQVPPTFNLTHCAVLLNDLFSCTRDPFPLSTTPSTTTLMLLDHENKTKNTVLIFSNNRKRYFQVEPRTGVDGDFCFYFRVELTYLFCENYNHEIQ